MENARVNPQFPSPQAKPGQQREYRVRSGDTLSGIALRELGNADRWREIKKVDGSTFTDKHTRKIIAGQSIYLPVTYQRGGGQSVVTPPPSTPNYTLPRTGAAPEQNFQIKKYVDERDYTGAIWTQIDVESGNEGKNHYVTIEWGNYKWQGIASPSNGGKTIILSYQKRNKDSIPRIIKVSPVPLPNAALNSIGQISSKTIISNGTGSKQGTDINSGWSEILPGYKLIQEEEAPGVALYKNGENFLQMVDLSEGASLKFVYGAPDNNSQSESPRIKRLSLDESWSELSKDPRAFSVVNGTFFDFNERFASSAELSFPFKANGEVISKGQALTPSNYRIFSFSDTLADVKPYSESAFFQSKSTNILVGSGDWLEENKSPNEETGRTFMGVKDVDFNGSYETIVVFSSGKSTIMQAVDIMKNNGVKEEKIIMLDGSNSSKLKARTQYLLNRDSSLFERNVPQMIGVLKKTT